MVSKALHIIFDIPSEASTKAVDEHALMLYSLDILGYKTPPLADILRKQVGLAGNCLIVTPLFWQATHNAVYVRAYGAKLQLDEITYKRYFQVLQEFLTQDNIKLHYYNATTWLLECHTNSNIQAAPPVQICNQPLAAAFTSLDATHYWQKFITECQMLFATQTANGPINGVWCWGGGQFVQSNLPIVADELLLPWAHILSTNVTVYTPKLDLSPFLMLLSSKPIHFTTAQQKTLSGKNTWWYWQNHRYEKLALPWWRRVWRTMIYDY